MFHVIGALAEFERALIQERVKSGIKNARAKGTRLGRPISLNGWHHAEVARLRAAGLSGRAIARQLKISEGSVRRMSSVSAAEKHLAESAIIDAKPLDSSRVAS